MHKVLITGGNGRLGHYIREELAPAYEVTVLDRRAAAADVQSIVGDIRDLAKVEHASRGQHAIVHLAAIPNPRHPVAQETIAINVIGTWTVMQAALNAGVPRVVYCSSDCATGLLQQANAAIPLYLPIDEAHPVFPAEPYGLSKHLAEQTVLAFARRGLEVVILRPGLVVFPGMEANVVAAGANESHPDLWWYGSARDVASAFRLALEVADAKDRTFFIGASNTCSASPTLDLVARRYGSVPPLRKPDLYREDPHAALFDTTLARDVLGFRTRDDWRDWAR